MFKLIVPVLLIYGFLACKSQACKCADEYVKAAKEYDGTNDPVKRIKILAKNDNQPIIRKCYSLYKTMSPEEKQAFDEEMNQCPSVRKKRESDSLKNLEDHLNNSRSIK